ncbi:AraC family transcriptional regulator [Nocardioides nanhaiensis]|uniref:AraC family transcriptional regulator n=1 Tax=Nocardioides nanhaiensis TaxID=1476871 RepID=A0ABP8W9H6_9ACTN
MTGLTSSASTRDVPTTDRTAFWEEYNEHRLVSLRCMTVHDDGLDAREVNVDLGEVCLADIAGNPHVIERGREHVDRTPKPSVFLTHLVSGSAFFIHAEGCLRLQAGDTVVYDASRPYLFGFETEMHQVLLDLPHAVLPRLGVATESLRRGAAISIGGRRSQVLLGLMQAGISPASGNTSTSAPAVDVQALVDAAVAAVAPEDASAAALVDAAAREIRAGLGDPALTPEAVARAVGVSSRHLNRLLGRLDGRTLGELIAAERLDAARRDLQDPALLQLRVADVAARWGFSSQAHFTRAFRRSFGVTPSQVRDAP